MTDHDDALDAPRHSRWPGLSSVRLRITLAATGLVAVGLAAASFGLVRVVDDNLVDDIERTNRQQLAEVARQVRQGTPLDEVRAPAQGAGTAPQIVIRRPGGSTITLQGTPNGPRPRRDQALETRRTVETQVGQITLIAQRSLAEVDRSVDSVTDALLIGVPLVVLVIAALAWYLAGRALRPVEAIRAEAAAITPTTMHRRVPDPGTDDEVGRLARTMNEMLERLDAAAVRQRQFVSDASHELRSPIAAVRAQLEVALRRDDPDWPTVAKAVLDEDGRLEEAVDELLELARLDEAGTRFDAEDVDLDDLVLDESHRTRQVAIDTTHVSAGRVRGNARQLGRVVRNLLDNACRHATTRVTVALEVDGAQVVLTVDDDGPGIPGEDRVRVFDRFTRLDEDRGRPAGGAGLGLALVRAVVERHHGRVAVEDTPLGGARFVVRIPAAASS